MAITTTGRLSEFEFEFSGILFKNMHLEFISASHRDTVASLLDQSEIHGGFVTEHIAGVAAVSWRLRCKANNAGWCLVGVPEAKN